MDAKHFFLLFVSLQLITFIVIYGSTNGPTFSINIAFKTFSNMTSVISEKVSYVVNKNFKPNQNNQKKKVRLVIGILSWFKKLDRRNASRSTWLQWSTGLSDQVTYRFFSDVFDRKLVENKIFAEEEVLHKDMVYFPKETRGWVFSNNQLFMIRYFRERYDFDYFMKADDDYFLCLEHLLFDMSYITAKRVWWGWGHCTAAVSWLDEGMNILTTGIVEEIMEKYNNNTLMCTFMADLSISMWLRDSPLEAIHFYDNDRVVHSVPSNEHVNNILKSNICHRYLAIHQSYPERMYKYWNAGLALKGQETPRFTKVNPRLEEWSHYCRYDRKFDLNKFKGTEFYKEPRPCKDIPNWGGHRLRNSTFRETHLVK